MPTDYAKSSPKKRKPATRGNTRKSPSKRSSHWPWVLAGFAFGVVSTLLIQLWQNPQQDIAKAIEKISNNEDNEPQQPRFDFYTLLRDSEVIVPDVEPRPTRTTADTDSSTDTSRDKEEESQPEKDIFLLQAGSFRDAGDADSLRVRLLLLNLDARVETASIRPGDTWYRVIIGPFNSRSKLAETRTTLLQNGVDNLVLKRK